MEKELLAHAGHGEDASSREDRYVLSGAGREEEDRHLEGRVTGVSCEPGTCLSQLLVLPQGRQSGRLGPACLALGVPTAGPAGLSDRSWHTSPHGCWLMKLRPFWLG